MGAATVTRGLPRWRARTWCAREAPVATAQSAIACQPRCRERQLDTSAAHPQQRLPQLREETKQQHHSLSWTHHHRAVVSKSRKSTATGSRGARTSSTPLPSNAAGSGVCAPGTKLRRSKHTQAHTHGSHAPATRLQCERKQCSASGAPLRARHQRRRVRRVRRQRQVAPVAASLRRLQPRSCGAIARMGSTPAWRQRCVAAGVPCTTAWPHRAAAATSSHACARCAVAQLRRASELRAPCCLALHSLPCGLTTRVSTAGARQRLARRSGTGVCRRCTACQHSRADLRVGAVFARCEARARTDQHARTLETVVVECHQPVHPPTRRPPLPSHTRVSPSVHAA
jgi:hypothetical protein